MAEGLNRVFLIGNLGQDPELRFTQSNQPVLSVRMATTESYFDNNTKERKERTEWHSVVIWGKRAEALDKILSKGSRICVEGRNQTRSWEDKQGEKRYTTEVVATNVVLLGDGRSGSHDQERHADAPPPNDGHGSGQSFAGDDDIPF